MEPKKGIYRHFKGGIYEVLFTARHSETEELMVIYRNIHDREKVWTRPLSMWNETVEWNDTSKPRFEYIGECDSNI